MADQACAIMRIEKLKNSGAIAGSEHHTQRSRETPNADNQKRAQNIRFIGDSRKLEDAIRHRIGDNGDKKIRQSADAKQQPVLALEMMLTASPEYFRPDAVDETGTWDADRLEAWFELNRQWLTDTFDDNVVRAELHLDESTPHIHAYIVPMDPKGHLNARHFVGGKKKLSRLQTEYSDAMAPVGLARGIKGSRAKHEKIKDYYKRVNKVVSPALSREDLERQATDRARQIEMRREAEQTARTLTEKVEHLEKTIQQKDQRIAGYQKTIAGYKKTIAGERKNKSTHKQLREIPLATVAQALGLTQNEVNPNRWQSRGHNIKITGSKFYDFASGRGGGGAIDLTMSVKRMTFQAAVQWLDDELGLGAGRAIAETEIEQAENAPRKYIGIPNPSLAQWKGLRAHLLAESDLPAKLIDQLYDQGLLYASSDGRAVFIERDRNGQHTGAMLRNRDGTYSRCTGETRGAFCVGNAQAKRVVFTATPLDAMAQRVLDGYRGNKAKYVSEGGPTAHVEHTQAAEDVSVSMPRGEKMDRAYQKIKADVPAVRQAPQEKSPEQVLRAKMKKLRREISSIADAMEQQEQNGL